MRVIAGIAKGHRLKSPKGSHIRPTSDIVRGAIFSLLEPISADWSRVLDLYAGTGALGVEALSRGAQWADFVEQKPRFCSIIRENLEHTRLVGKAHVYCCSVRKAFSFLDAAYGLVFLDPPYSDSSIPKTLERLFSSSLVNAESTVVIEHWRHRALEAAYGRFHLIRNLRHGDSSVSVYQSTDRRSDLD